MNEADYTMFIKFDSGIPVCTQYIIASMPVIFANIRPLTHHVHTVLGKGDGRVHVAGVADTKKR